MWSNHRSSWLAVAIKNPFISEKNRKNIVLDIHGRKSGIFGEKT